MYEKNERVRRFIPNPKKKKKNVQNAEAQIVSCFSFTFHVAERVEGKKGRKKGSERRVEERERERERKDVDMKGGMRGREKEKGTTTERTAVRDFPRLDKELDRSPVFLIRKQSRVALRCVAPFLYRLSLKWVIEFARAFYRSLG